MSKLPTDLFGTIIFLIDLGIIAFSIDEATKRLRNGIAATAQREGRDVSDEEDALLKQLEDESDRRRRGGV